MTTRPNLIRIPHKRWPTEIWRSVRNHAMRSHPEVDQHTRQYVLETLDLLHAQSGSFEEQNYLEIERSLDRAIGNLKGLPFIVVDANGGGNYKTLATAVAAVPAGDAALIIITNGGGNFDTITVNTGSQIYVMMSQPSANPLLSGNVVTLDHITSGGTGSLVAFVDCNVNFSNATSLDNGYTGAIWFLNCPFVSSTSAGANLANGGSNTFYGVNTLFSIGSQTGAMNNYGTAAFVNCNFTKLFSDTAAVASIQLTNCVIQALASFQTTNITVAMGGAGTVVQFNNCTIGLPTSTHSFGITFNASTSSTQVWQFADCTFNTPGTTTIAVTSMNDGSSFVVTGCRFQQRAHSVVFTLATTGKSTIEFSGNDAQMVTVTQTGHTDTNMHISGVYQKISIATNGAVVDAVLNLQATGGPGVTISGDGALVMASFQNGSGASTGLSISGNNAICFLTNIAAVTTPFSNSGSGNNINSLPPNGPAGGDLTGTYPNPTLTSVTSAAGPTGSTSVIPIVAIDAKGRVVVLSSAVPTLSSIGAPTADVPWGSRKITSVTDPTNPQDAATKNYVDSVASGLSIKQACRLATAAALATNTYALGVITASGNAALSVDGIAVATNDRILVKNEASALKNGIYVVTQTGSTILPFILTRSSDMNTSAEIPGAFTVIEDGSTLEDTGWVVVGSGPFTIGTTAINWTQFGSGGPPSGAAGGDLAGSYPNPTLTTIISAGGPTGSTSVIPIITYDAKGRLTVVTTATPTISTIGTPTGDVAWGSNKITGVKDPTSAQDAMTKNYADANYPPKSVPTAQIHKSGTTAVANSTSVTVSLATTDYDAFSMVSGNTLVVPSGWAGVWLLTGQIVYPAVTSGEARSSVAVNGSTALVNQSAGGTGVSPLLDASGAVRLAVGDVVSLVAFQTSGGSVTLAINAITLLQATWLCP